jgi:hypothetical protein
MDTNLIAIVAVVVLLLVVAGVLLSRRRRTETLREQFGPEYHHAVNEMGSPSKAEAELLARQKRVKKLDIVPLSPADADRFTRDWRAVQTRFVDSPQGALFEADQLVRELMLKRGYPMGDFDSRAADISVDHPAVVDHYRSAHDIVLRDQRGEADTEALRQAIVHYRALFGELLEVASPAAAAREAERERATPRREVPLREHAMAQREPRSVNEREIPR